MHRSLVLCATVLFALMPALTPGSVSAQSMGTRAYAPENLRALAPADRSRVIGLEYAEQANGRRIPDDQLRFYMDQVNSGWTFSRIRQDIATSLRGGGNGRPGGQWGDNGGGHGSGNGGWQGGNGAQTVRCESRDKRQRLCPTPGWRNASVARQLSGTACVRGRNWDVRNGQIQVDQGCRADFVEARGWGNGWNDRPGDGRPGGWQNGYSMTCSSEGNRRRSCAWDPRQGRPVLVEQISGTHCIEGRTWGYAGNAVWVDKGCRARFGTR